MAVITHDFDRTSYGSYALPAATPIPPEPVLTDLQRKIFLDRYALPSDNECVSNMWLRVAHATANSDAEFAEFLELLSDFRYVPGGRILSAMGNPGVSVTASNCYVIPSPHDSRHGIVDSIREWIDIQATGGGVGINISTLRPKGSPVKSVNGTSSGPTTWAQLFAFISHDIIIQGGTRRGAAMIMMNDHHPDIFEFIHAKEALGVLEGANISVCVSDSFMRAVTDDADWELWWCEDMGTDEHIRGVREAGHKMPCCQPDGHVPARQLWYDICHAAHASGEPGVYFMDRANKQANSGYFENLISSNPCAEQPLGPYGACLLGSINLMAFVRQPRRSSSSTDSYFDADGFVRAVASAVKFNDNIIDKSSYPTEECRMAQQRIRRMGIGVMGLADVLIALGLRYGSKEAILWTRDVFRLLATTAYDASAALAMTTGSFPEWTAEYWQRPFASKMLKYTPHNAWRGRSMRNCYLISQAPTGTISLLAGVNSGIEPFFDFNTTRVDRTGTSQINQADYAARRNAHYSNGAETRHPYVIASDITPEQHILMQAAVQEWCDSAVSKTVNAPHDATVESVEQLYMLAYDSGLKSIAYYRDGSRDTQVLYHSTTPEQQDAFPSMSFKAGDGKTYTAVASIQLSNAVTPLNPDTHGEAEIIFPQATLAEVFNADALASWINRGIKPNAEIDLLTQSLRWGTRQKLPDTCEAKRHKFTIDGVEGYIHTGEYDDGALGEFFLSFSKAGSTVAGLVDSAATAWSCAIQYGMPLKDVVAKLKGSRFEPHGITRNPDIPTANSIMDYIGRWISHTYLGAPLDEVQATGTPAPLTEVIPVLPPDQQKQVNYVGDVCPECLTMAHRAEGCVICPNCGWSKC